MADLNNYLRRADVEGLIQTKLDAITAKMTTLTEQMGNHAVAGDNAKLAAASYDLASYAVTRSVLNVVKSHLKFCEQFTLHPGHDTNEAGIAELRDASGQNIEPDGRRWKNEG